MFNSLGMRRIVFPVIFILAVSGCASFNPRPLEEVPFRERAQTKSEGNVRVTAAVPSPDESRRLFGVSVYRRGVQPIWLKIENNNEDAVYFLPVGLDPDYFSPFEASYVNHFEYVTRANDEMDRTFFKRSYLAGARARPLGIDNEAAMPVFHKLTARRQTFDHRFAIVTLSFDGDQVHE